MTDGVTRHYSSDDLAQARLLRAAVSYADRGWHVLPLAGKRPTLPDWPNRASSDPDDVDEWWGERRTSNNVGILTGAKSGLVVLDVDGDAGEESLLALETEHSPLPATLTSHTGGGGRHLYFRHPGGHVPNKAGVRPGLDVRGDRGQVVAPPSRHPTTGERYRWLAEDAPVADLPGWFAELLVSAAAVPTAQSTAAPGHGGQPSMEEADAYARAALDEEVERVRSAPVGARNDALNRAAFSLGQLVAGGALAEDDVVEALAEAGQAAGLPAAEVAATIRSGMQGGAASPRTVPAVASEDAKLRQEVEKLRRQRRARALVSAEEAAADFTPPPTRLTLKDELLVERPPLAYTLSDLHPTGSNAILAAQYKTGKTTLALNLVRALADGEKFLGGFDAATFSGRVAWWNYELTEDQALAWLVEMKIENPDRVALVNLRDYRVPLQTPVGEDWAVDWLGSRDVKFWIVDPFGAAFPGNENDNSEVRDWLHTLDVIKRLAGVPDLLLPSHTGRVAAQEGEERARGATRLDDWADVRWTLTRQQDARFLRAYGRGVEVSEFQLSYEPRTRTLGTAGTFNRRDARDAEAMRSVVEAVRADPGIATGELREKVKGRKAERDGHIRKAIAAGFVRTEPAGKAIRHYLTDRGEQYAR